MVATVLDYKIKFLFMKKLLSIICFFVFGLSSNAQIIISEKSAANTIPIVSATEKTFIYTDSTDDWLIQKSVQFLQQDIELVTSKKPFIIHSLTKAKGNLIVVGSISYSKKIQHLAAINKINIDSLKGKWEAFTINSISPLSATIKNAIIICGSDKRFF